MGESLIIYCCPIPKHRLRCDISLDLTAASRAYLMEPQWNPTVEEQAFARVHRMGQLEQVTTIRYIMKDSYEDVSALLSCFMPLSPIYSSMFSTCKTRRSI
jgi:hypothetical protein